MWQKKVDFAVINIDAPHLILAWDPVSPVVSAAHGSDVDTVVIDGQIVMQDRKVLTLDEEDILEDIRRRHRTVSDQAGLTMARDGRCFRGF